MLGGNKEKEHWQMSYSRHGRQFRQGYCQVRTRAAGLGYDGMRCGFQPLQGGIRILAMKDAMAGNKGERGQVSGFPYRVWKYTVKAGHCGVDGRVNR